MDIKCDFLFHKPFLQISEERTDNYLRLDDVDYFVSYLDSDYKSNKGGNSFVFALYVAQTYDEDAIPERVIKISKNPEPYKNNRIILKDKNQRFRQEIAALYDCKQRNVSNVIDIAFDGNLLCRTQDDGDYKVSFPFYVMEYAEYDLKSFLEEENMMYDVASRVELCLQIAQGIKELNDLGYYHRDIKPDNIFMINGIWKVGDLGLIQMRNKPSLDKKGELLGPRGWLSPEAMNKYLSEKIEGKNFDCSIDHQSDLFQLAKVFWYILQGNAPIGCIKESDFLVKNSSLYSLLKQMLNHSKKKRPASVDIVISDLQRIVSKYYKV
jgi:serine/threonine protein kinase